MNRLAYIALLFIAASCGRETYPEYRDIGHEVQMKLIRLGEGERPPAKGDVLTLWLGVSLQHEAPGVLYYNTYEHHFDGNSDLDHCLLELQEGDSAKFMMPYGSLKGLELLGEEVLPDTTTLSVEVGLTKLRTKEEHELERRAFHKWLNDKDLSEQEELLRYIKGNGMVPEEHYLSGIYYLEELRGEGRRLQNGDLLSIQYSGRFLDSTLFDSSYRSKQPLVFRLGDPGQVVAGMEIGLRQMRAGGKATLIIPSQLGFGHLGSSTGIIPPFTTLIYEVEIESILGEEDS